MVGDDQQSATGAAAPAADAATTAAPAETATDASTSVAQTGSDLISGKPQDLVTSEDADVKEFLDLVGTKRLPEINSLLKAGVEAQAAADAPKEDNPLVDWAESLHIKPFQGMKVKDAQDKLQAHNEANQPGTRM